MPSSTLHLGARPGVTVAAALAVISAYAAANWIANHVAPVPGGRVVNRVTRLDGEPLAIAALLAVGALAAPPAVRAARLSARRPS